jgi:tripartite-type tricarboxylate transporter receptor subunit TctC
MMYRLRPVLLSLVMSLAGALLCTAGANAQNGPIKILVGLPPGGAVDIGARIVGEKIAVSLGQPVVVENPARVRPPASPCRRSRPPSPTAVGREIFFS